MSKKSSINKLALAVFALILVWVYVLLFKQPKLSAPNKLFHDQNLINTPYPYRYDSSWINISFSITQEFEIEESIDAISLRSNNGEIQIDKNSTNKSSALDYINNLQEMNKVDIVDRELVKNQYDIVETTLKYPLSGREDKRVYFIYPDQWTVYILSTTSPELYDDLEAIVQSFEYLGE